jgi:hypothetical protein
MDAKSIQSGRGKGRNPWRIREYLADLGLTMADVGRMANVQRQVAQETVRGTRNHRRVLEALEGLGCPSVYLYPEHQQEVKSA